MQNCDFSQRKCRPCEGGVPPLNAADADALLARLKGWERIDTTILRTFSFKNYYETMAFVNAAAYIAHQEDHHPEMVIGYKTCRVTYCTHSIGGLSENDFICAAKLDAL